MSATGRRANFTDVLPGTKHTRIIHRISTMRDRTGRCAITVSTAVEIGG
jgi:hypothetical protein